MVAAQALEQAVELLQPGTGRRTVVRLGHQCQLGQGRKAYRVKRLFGTYHGTFVWNEATQLPQAQTDQRDHEQQ
ncbi:hypothetical protein D3C75_1065760 [compost metagenome]